MTPTTPEEVEAHQYGYDVGYAGMEDPDKTEFYKKDSHLSLFFNDGFRLGQEDSRTEELDQLDWPEDEIDEVDPFFDDIFNDDGDLFDDNDEFDDDDEFLTDEDFLMDPSL